MRQPGLTCAKGVANGGKSFPEQKFPSPSAGALGLGVVRPETDAPHGVKWASVSQRFDASAQKVLLHGRVLCEVGKNSCKDGVFTSAVQDFAVEVSHALNRHVRVRVGLARALSALLRRGVGKGEPFQPSYTAVRRTTARRERQTAREIAAKNRRGAATTAPPTQLNNREWRQTPTVSSRRWPQLRCVGLAVYFSENTGPLVHDTSLVLHELV